MRQLLVKKIIKHIEESNILYDYSDCEAMDIAYYDECKILKDYVNEQDLTAFMVNMAIMYVNQGLLYAKCKLSKKDFENYMIWFHIEKNEYMMEWQHYYDCQTLFTRKAEYILGYYKNPIEISTISIYDKIKCVSGLSDFYCYEYQYESNDYAQYTFIPKFFVDRYNANKNK